MMISPVLLSAAILVGALAGDGPAPDPSDLGVYKSASTAAGHDADAHVRLALWCEAHNLSAERISIWRWRSCTTRRTRWRGGSRGWLPTRGNGVGPR